MNKREEMLEQLKKLYDDHGRITRNIMRHKKVCPTVGEYSKEFGDMKIALQLAGIDYRENQDRVLKDLKLSREFLLSELVRFNNEIGYPTIRGLDANKDYPSSSIFLNVFWSIKNAIEESEVEVKSGMAKLYNRKEYSDKEMLDMLYKANKERIANNKPLMTANEIDADDTLPHSGTYNSRLGSFEDIYRKIGIENYLQYNLHTSDEHFKKCYIQVRDIIKRMPTSRDLNHYSAKGICPSANAYSNHFGSLLEFQVSMGDQPNMWATLLSNDELIEKLIDFSKQLGITPTQNDVDDCEDMPSSSIYCIRFGTFLNAVTQAGLKPRSSKSPLITPNGNYALSGYEYKFLLMLEKYNFKFKKEAMYKDYIENYEYNHRFDFVLDCDGEEIFIEIFGMINREDYVEKTKYKINLCKENNIKLISIFPNDISQRNLDEIYAYTINEINKIKEAI